MQPSFGLVLSFCTVKCIYSALLQPEEHIYIFIYMCVYICIYIYIYIYIFKNILDSCIQMNKVFVATYCIVYTQDY